MTTPTPPPKQAHAPAPGADRRYLLILALSAAAILVVGGLLRPRADEGNAPAPMPDGELARLRQAAQRRSLLDETDYFRSLANDLGSAIRHQPEYNASSVAWSMDRFVTTTAAAHGPRDDDSPLPAPASRPVQAVPALPPGAPPLVRAGGSVAPGDWVVAVWQSADGRGFVPGRYAGAATTLCAGATAREVLTSLPLTAPMAGAGIFDVYGALIGVVARCGGRLAALAAGSVDTLLAEAASVRGRLLDRYGLEVVTLGTADAAFFEVEAGALVQAVWAGGVAERSGLLPGDVIVAVNDEPVSTPDDLGPLVGGDNAAALLTVSRGGPSMEIALGAGDTPASRPNGLRMPPVPAESAAARSGLREGDLVFRVNRVDVRTPAQLAPLFEAELAARLLVDTARGNRRWGTFVE